MRRHAELLGELSGEERGCVEFRKHIAWYLKGFAAGSTVRQQLGTVSSFADLDAPAGQLDPDRAVPGPRARHPPRPAGHAQEGDGP